MGKKLVSRTAKVLSETKKSKDREAVAIAYEHIPRNPDEQKHGSLYAVIEIEDNGGHAEEIAERIVDLFHSEYYDDLDKEPLSSFEAALAKINEDLAERSSEGQINWIGKLNAVLGVLVSNTLHLTQAGRSDAYLYRGETTIQITEDLAGDTINPLRTFMNIASGDLAEDDRLALVTPGVFYKLSKTELKKYVTDTTPKAAVENLSKILSGENGTILPNAILIIEMISPEAFAAEAEPETEAWIKEEKKTIEPIAEETLTGAVKAFDVVGKAFGSASAFISAKAVPTTQHLVTKVKEFKKNKEASRILLESEERVSHEIEDTGILEAPKENGFEREIRIKESNNRPKLLSLEKVDFSLAKKARNFSSNLKPIKLPKGKFSYVYLVCALVALLSIGGYIYYNGNQDKQRFAAESTFAQAKSKYESAVSYLSQGQRSLAIEDLNVAEKLANDSKKSNVKLSEVESLLSEIAKTREQALGITSVKADVFGDFESQVNFLLTDGTTFFGIEGETGSIYTIDSKSKIKATLAEKAIPEKVNFATYLASRKVIITYTESDSLYEFDPATKKAKKLAVSGGVAESVAMASYLSNIYILSPSENQIYKHQKATSGFAKKTNYISKATPGEISDAVGIAIDSDIYTVNASGKINKYTAGVKKDYTLKGAPGEFKNVKGIYTDPDVSGLYLITENSIIKIDQEQNFVAEYRLDGVTGITGITVNDKTKTIYALASGTIYSFGN